MRSNNVTESDSPGIHISSSRLYSWLKLMEECINSFSWQVRVSLLVTLLAALSVTGEASIFLASFACSARETPPGDGQPCCHALPNGYAVYLRATTPVAAAQLVPAYCLRITLEQPAAKDGCTADATVSYVSLVSNQ